MAGFIFARTSSTYPGPQFVIILRVFDEFVNFLKYSFKLMNLLERLIYTG